MFPEREFMVQVLKETYMSIPSMSSE